MTTLREAAQQVLEAIDWLRLHLQRDHQCLHMDPAQSGIPAWINRSETNLRAALAEPEHEIIQRMRRLRAEAQAEQQQAIEQGKCPSCMQPLPEELKTEYQSDDDLRNAAMQKLTDVQQEMEAGCDHCRSPMWCGYKCKSCGKVWKWASGIEGEPNEPTR